MKVFYRVAFLVIICVTVIVLLIPQGIYWIVTGNDFLEDLVNKEVDWLENKTGDKI